MPRNFSTTSTYGKVLLGLITGLVAGTAALLVWASMGTTAGNVSTNLYQSVLSPNGPQCCDLTAIGLGFIRIKHYILGLVLMPIGIIMIKIAPFLGAFIFGFGAVLFTDEVII